MNNKQFRNVTYLSDRSGTGCWRIINPYNIVNCLALGLNILADYSQTPILDLNYYSGMNMVRVLRWISPQQRDLFCKFLTPLMILNNGWTIYEEDDAMFDGTLLNESKRQYLTEKYGDIRDCSIPSFNRGRKAFEGVEVLSLIKEMLNTADLVTVTTDYLKEYYHDFYDVPLDNIVAVPNLLPKYLYEGRYDLAKKVKQFGKNKNKPRIGIVSSLSHFNIDNVRHTKDGFAVREEKNPDGTSKWIDENHNEVRYEDTSKITDDFDDIADVVRLTVDDFLWICFGYCPPQIQDLVNTGKVMFLNGVPIMNYPAALDSLQFQAIIAPIKKIPFNYCKSFIKTMECAAIGVPLFATKCLPYDRVMNEDLLFEDLNDLKDKLMKLKMMSTDSYSSLVERQWRWLNSPTQEGDFKLNNFWLEDNMHVHLDLMRLRPNSVKVSLALFIIQYEARKNNKQNEVMFLNDNIQIVR